jgi:hypothetical protein
MKGKFFLVTVVVLMVLVCAGCSNTPTTPQSEVYFKVYSTSSGQASTPSVYVMVDVYNQTGYTTDNLRISVTDYTSGKFKLCSGYQFVIQGYQVSPGGSITIEVYQDNSLVKIISLVDVGSYFYKITY